MDVQGLAWKVSEFLMIPFLRGPLTHFSSIIKERTGIWFHPCTWQTVGLLVLAGFGYWLYVFVRGAKA